MCTPAFPTASTAAATMMQTPQRFLTDCTAPALPSEGIAILVPVYNEATTVGSVLAAISATLRPLSVPTTILVIDDGSTDASRAVVAQLADPRICVIAHPTNQGYGAALTAGLRHTDAPRLAIIDADGTYPVAALPALLAGLDDAAMVVGARITPPGAQRWLRTRVKGGLRRLAEHLTGQPIADLNSGLRAMRRAALLPLLPILPQRFSWTSTVTVALLRSGATVRFTPIPYHPRDGHAKFQPLPDTLRTLACILRAAHFRAQQRR